MSGLNNVRFSELFADTVKTHGTIWAWEYYSKRGMSQKEFKIWRKAMV